MHLDVDVNIDEIHQALEETFLAVLPKDEQEVHDEKMQTEVIDTGTGNDNGADGSPITSHPSIQHQHDHDEYWKWSSNMKRPPVIERDVSDASTSRSSSSMISGSRQNVAASASNIAATSSSPIQEVDGKSKRSAGIKSGSTIMSENIATPTTTTTKPVHERKQSDSSTTVHSSSHSRNPSYASASKGAASNPNQQTLSSEVGGDTSTIDTELLQNSIFAATSEYIITGNELANRSITVSTHDMHILSRPQIICDTQRYERNSLLFAVGFVLRRGDNVDPCHFWPVLSKLSSTLYDMEVESEFLSNGRTRPQIQIILEDILISLNSSQMECHLLLDNANLMNLQLYHPPPSQAAAPPVQDYAVPILLRPEWQLQMYDWDLTINWIVPHIDGCQYVKQIAASTEVDMEMVRACLRVLRHHGVLTYVDVFRYSNLYEFQGYERLHTNDGVDEKKSKKTDAVKKVLTEAFWYAAKSKYVTRSQPMTNTAPSFGNTPVTPWAYSKRTNNISDEISPLPRSFPSLMGHFPMRKEHPPDVDDDDTVRSDRLVRCPDRKEIAKMTNALEQMYCSFCRDKSFGDVLLEKVGSMTDPSSSESKKCHDVSSCDENNNPAQCHDNNDNDRGIDWNHVFDYFDHRRLVTFGLFRGLIRRVHQYPLACAIKIENEESSMSDAVREGKEKDFDCDTDNMAGFELSAVAKEAASIAGGLTMEERSLATSCSASPLQSTSAAVSFNGRTDISVSKAAQKEVDLRSRGLLMARVAHAMDGTRCDDELSCMFDAPIEHLIEMLEDTGRWNVISVYSCVE